MHLFIKELCRVKDLIISHGSVCVFSFALSKTFVVLRIISFHVISSAFINLLYKIICYSVMDYIF